MMRILKGTLRWTCKTAAREAKGQICTVLADCTLRAVSGVSTKAS